MNTRAIVPGSLSAIAERDGMSVAESFLSADAICIVDVSGSMDDRDARGSQRRYDVACQELRQLQAEMPGRVAVVAFSDTVQFCPGGVPPFLGGSTDLAAALLFAIAADGTVRFIVISDGRPDSPEDALRVARAMTSKIDTIFVGPEDDQGGGRKFLADLAAARGGRHVVAAKAAALAEKAQSLMLTAGA